MLHKTFSRCARGLYHLTILTKMTILKTATNAGLHNCASRRFNKNGSFSSYEGIYAWLQILKRDLDGNENLRKNDIIFC